VKELEKRLRLYTLNVRDSSMFSICSNRIHDDDRAQLDMEKVCEYIQQELESSPDPADQRILIAEVALIDKQIMTMAAGLINMPAVRGGPLAGDVHFGPFFVYT
jgi:hypothetical protein